MALHCRVLLKMALVMLIAFNENSRADSDLRAISYEDLMSSAVIFSDIRVAYYSQLLFDVTRDQLVVGARDHIYRLKIDNLQTLQRSAWPAGSDKIESCLEKGQSEEDCRNYVKVLLTDGSRLFACGTNAFSPLCSWREIQNTDKVSIWPDGRAKCPYNPHANITSLMTERGVYFVGTPVDFTGTDSAIVKDFGGASVRTDQFDSKWLNEPQFVGSFETDSYVYFFFRESAVEYMNCGKKIYSRIARVCKDDPGARMMWTTFLKARVNCSLPGDYPFYFDEIQGITYLPDEGIIYATFNTPRNSIHGSAICAFNTSAIAAAFEGPYKHQDTMNSAWEKRNPTYQRQCRNGDGRNSIDSFKYQLMDNAVQPVRQVPLYHTELETIVHIAVDVVPTKLHREVHIMYVSTDDNRIKKMSVLPRTMQTCVLEIWRPLGHPTDEILSMQFLKQTESLYISTKQQIIRVPGQHCKRHKTKLSCINAMDPYCGWNELKDKCSPPPDKNPSTMFWQQSVDSCPSFDHPVPGGWSEWSPWISCNLANVYNEAIGQCLCSTRQCSNPSPQNGGPPCEGVSTQVTNCTQHGEWTNWSEWSACSASCGTAVKTRKRTCSNPAPAYGGRVCVGPDTQEVYCIGNPPCPEPSSPDRDGHWSAWSSWSECSAKCGGGYRFRTRKCDSPPPMKPDGRDCQGCNVDYEVCNDIFCPEIKRLSSWTPWYSMQNGTEKRFRFSCKAPVTDLSSIKIALSKEDERICQAGGLCYKTSRPESAEDSWSEWSPWSVCTSECDGGTQFRSRNCELRNEDCIGLSRQSRTCNTHPCRGEWSCWTDWSSCSVTCGIGIRQRSRTCWSTGNRSQESTNCDGSSFNQERCEMPPCPTRGWLQWSPWTECDDQNLQHRSRKCSVSNPTGNMCLGPERESKSCDDMSNDISNALGVQIGQYGDEPPSTFASVVFCLLAFGAGVGVSGAFCYYWMKTHQRTLPSSPHYISKQNPYVTVPLKETHTPKRTPSFSKNTLTMNGAPKFSKTAASSSGSADYETATIKRNSHSLLNGHARTSALEQERFF